MTNKIETVGNSTSRKFFIVWYVWSSLLFMSAVLSSFITPLDQVYGTFPLGLVLESALVGLVLAFLTGLVFSIVKFRIYTMSATGLISGCLVSSVAAFLLLPGFVDNHHKWLRHHLMDNARKLQMSVEVYAFLHRGVYPATVSDLNKCENLLNINPFTKSRESPVLGKVKDPKFVQSNPPGPLLPGQIEYSPLASENSLPSDYVIRIGWEDGNAMPGDSWPRSIKTDTFVLCHEQYQHNQR